MPTTHKEWWSIGRYIRRAEDNVKMSTRIAKFCFTLCLASMDAETQVASTKQEENDSFRYLRKERRFLLSLTT